MRNWKYIIAGMLSIGGITGCNNIINLDPISNVGVENYYRNYSDVLAALTGCYHGLQQPLETEWMMTELRSDNAKQGVPNSTSASNIELNQLDMYTLNPTHPKVYDYWLSVYKNIRSINYVLKSLGVTYNNGQIVFNTPVAVMTDAQRDQLAGEALFLRAYHYFNLIRLYGGVFLLTEPVDPKTSKQVNRATVQECYDLVTADLLAAKDRLSQSGYGQMPKTDLGRAGSWAAKALLAKMYLTLQRKSDALPLLDDVINNSGYGLESSYSRVFSVDNEMNQEILFAVRYKAGGVGLGSFMANSFAPTGSGSAVVNGDGSGFNYPTNDIDSMYHAPADQRKEVVIGKYAAKLYTKKYLSTVLVKNDAENDFPVIRFADVLLMKAEAIGYDGAAGTSVGLINRIRERAGAVDFTGGDFQAGFYKYPAAGDANTVNDDAQFMKALLNERRLELAYENQRFFDLLRTGQAAAVIKAYYAAEFASHYSRIVPAVTLEELQTAITDNRLLLPIPQREMDTNDQIVIVQNPGY